MFFHSNSRTNVKYSIFTKKVFHLSFFPTGTTLFNIIQEERKKGEEKQKEKTESTDENEPSRSSVSPVVHEENSSNYNIKNLIAPCRKERAQLQYLTRAETRVQKPAPFHPMNFLDPRALQQYMEMFRLYPAYNLSLDPRFLAERNN